MSMCLDGEVFAKLVGRYPDEDMLLFLVSEGLMNAAYEWSPLCRFRFVRSEDGLAYMEIFSIKDAVP